MILQNYIAYLNDNPKGYWFKRKLYGWGWTPVRLQGWVVIFGYVGFLWYFFVRADVVSHSGSDTLYGFAIPVIIATAILIGICYARGEKPRWQWGVPKKED